jgi:hypothetical protein
MKSLKEPVKRILAVNGFLAEHFVKVRCTDEGAVQNAEIPDAGLSRIERKCETSVFVLRTPLVKSSVALIHSPFRFIFDLPQSWSKVHFIRHSLSALADEKPPNEI